MKATAKAHPNIALVKYWGKRNEKLILPHQSSLSVTLGPLSVTTTVEFTGQKGADRIELNGKVAAGGERTRGAPRRRSAPGRGGDDLPR